MQLTPKTIGVIAVVIVIAAGALAARSYQENQKLKQEIESLRQGAEGNNGTAEQEAQIEEVIAAVDKLIALPEGEEPTMATITDREKLDEVPFFANAQNGDKVLIYVNARKAYLYRPSDQKVIDVANLSLQGQSPSPSSSATPTR